MNVMSIYCFEFQWRIRKYFEYLRWEWLYKLYYFYILEGFVVIKSDVFEDY